VGENIYNRVPPSSLEAERAVLGACLVDREALNMVMETLVPDDFYDLNHRLAFDIICDMAQRDKPVDALTFLEESTKRELVEKIGGQPFIAGLVNGVTTTANAEYYALIVKDKSISSSAIHLTTAPIPFNER
jgi:replicative DNA helicase